MSGMEIIYQIRHKMLLDQMISQTPHYKLHVTSLPPVLGSDDTVSCFYGLAFGVDEGNNTA